MGQAGAVPATTIPYPQAEQRNSLRAKFPLLAPVTGELRTRTSSMSVADASGRVKMPPRSRTDKEGVVSAIGIRPG
jgi:hypothetical protein